MLSWVVGARASSGETAVGSAVSSTFFRIHEFVFPLHPLINYYIDLGGFSLHCVASDLQGSSCLYLLCAVTTGPCHHSGHFYMVSGDWTQVLMLEKQVLCRQYLSSQAPPHTHTLLKKPFIQHFRPSQVLFNDSTADPYPLPR